MSNKPIIGVLALQGAVEPHRKHIEAAGAQFRAVKTPEQFDAVDAFIIPGGESTTMLKLIERFNLWDILVEQFAKKPVWGICAGTILMAETVLLSTSSRAQSRDLKYPEKIPPLPSVGRDDGQSVQKSFNLLPITVERNGYGRQLESHYGEVNGYPVSFIRAPLIEDAQDCKIIATHNDTPVWIQNGQYMATTFHPELTNNFPSPMHQYFVDKVNNYAAGVTA